MPATQKQIAYLEGLGVRVHPKLTLNDAAILIDATLDTLPATHRQLLHLADLGVPIERSVSQRRASQLIDSGHIVSEYAVAFCDVFFVIRRRSDGTFIAGNRPEFNRESIQAVVRIIMSDPELLATVIEIQKHRERHFGPIDQDATFLRIASRLSRQSGDSLFERILDRVRSLFG
jgi:hypothetical protein